MLEYTADQLERIQALEFDALKQFLSVCEKLNLKYYLLGGTLLGAVRHGGFIPWDDDIDVGMPRKDYEIFVREGQSYLPPPYFIQHQTTDPEFVSGFIKIRNSNTTFIETSVVGLNINHGVFIDIFPLDFYPETGVACFKLKQAVLNLRVTCVYKKLKASLRTKILRVISCLLCPSVYRAVVKRDAMFRQVKEGKWMANHYGAWGEKEIVPAEWFGEGRFLSFGGISCRVPDEYEKWLTQVYGDYMQLPPPEKRITHHYTEMIDFDQPYTKYIKR